MSHRKPHRSSLSPPPSPPGEPPPSLEVVLKADAVGTLEAVAQAVAGVSAGPLRLGVVRGDVGDVAQADVLLAATAGRLILGFQVDVPPRVETYAREQSVEVRLYRVIYDLTRDAEQILSSLLPREPGERILGKAKVIALFKGSRKGIILGCEVLEGTVALGQRYRVVDPAGEIHQGRVESLHIGPDAVRQARPGQEVGLKIEGFQKARIGDWVECFEPVPPAGPRPWVPHGGVLRVEG